MNNNIAKPYSITIESKSVKPVKGDFKCFLGDTVDLTIKVLRDGQSKYLDNCKVSILYERQDSTVSEQLFEDGGIFIINNIITIRPKENSMLVGMNKISINISSEIETIKLPLILFYVNDVVDSSVITDNSEDIKTIEQLKHVLTQIPEIEDNVNQLKIDVDKDIELVNTKISDAIIHVDQSVADLNKDVDEKLTEIDNKVNNKITEIDNVFVKNIKLIPYISGSYVYFKTKPIIVKASDLICTTLNATVSGSPYSSTIVQSCNFIINFFVDTDGNVKTNRTIFNDNGVQGNYISANILFNYNPNTVGAELIITTKIKKEYLSAASGFITSLGLNIN